MTRKQNFIPDWYEGETPIGTFRALFKWHELNAFKHPNRGFYNLLRDTFQLSDQDFKNPRLCLDPIEEKIPSSLDQAHIHEMEQIVGKHCSTTDC